MDGSLETWLHDLEMEEDPRTFPEFYTKKMSSLGVEIATKQKEPGHQLTDQKLYHQPETNNSTGFSFSEASLSFSYLNGNYIEKPTRNPLSPLGSMNWIEFDAAMNNGDKWRSKVTTPLPLPHHLVVERKRRQDLNQRFLALSRVVPGKKKKDKASILGEAVKYMKDLQERIKNLDEKSKKKVVESVVFVKRSSSSSSPSSNQYLPYGNNDDNNNNDGNYSYRSYVESNDDNFSNKKSMLLPEIEAKVIERSVLIRVHCGNQKGILPTLLTEIAKLHLIVVTTNAVPFGNDTDITVIAQMGADFCMKTKDIVEYLRLALPNFI